MHVKVMAYPPYRDGLGAGTVHLQMPEGATLRDVLRELAGRSQPFTEFASAKHDEWLWGQLLVHAKGEIVRLNDQVNDGDVLELLPPIAGG